MKTLSALFIFFCLTTPVLAQDDKKLWIDRSGNFVNFPGDYLDEEYDGISLYRENGKYGFKDVVGQTKVEARYDLALNVGKGFAAFAYKASAEAWYIFDIKGKMVHGSPFKKIHSLNDAPEEKPRFLNGLLAVESISVHKMGCLDTTGHLVIPEIYDYIKDLGEPVLYIGKEGQHGIMNKKTKQENLMKYEKIMEFSQGLAAVSKKGKWGYINYEGKEVIAAKFLSAGYFFNNQAAVTILDGKTSSKKFINLKGDLIENSPYSWNTQVTLIYEEVMVVKNENQKTGLFDRYSGKQLTEFIFINDPVFVNGYASCIDASNKAILVNEKGETVLKGYDGFGTVHEGLVCAYKKETLTDASGKTVVLEKSGYLDLGGNIVIPFSFGGTSYFTNGIAEIVRFEDYQNFKVAEKKKK